jgi:beta-glucosidase
MTKKSTPDHGGQRKAHGRAEAVLRRATYLLSSRRTRSLPLTRMMKALIPVSILLCAGMAQGEELLKIDVAQKRADALIAKMTLAEKISLIRGVEEPAQTNQGQAGYLAGVPRLGIPPIRMADGPPGVLTRLPSQGLTSTMGLAATFSTHDAKDNGAVIASEAKRLGIDVVLQPFINIDRDLTFGRGYNTFGEDPFLTGIMAAAQITGTQSQGVMAQAKHFVGYDTNAHSVEIDPQTLHEVYLAPFASAIDAGVSSIMCSYNMINGAWACSNRDTLGSILRGEMNFKGFVTSDWGAVHTNEALNAGLDMEMPGVLPSESPFASFMYSYFDIDPAIAAPTKPDFGTLATVFMGGMPEEPKRSSVDFSLEFPADPKPENLAQALAHRQVTETRINEAARRVLTQIIRFRLAGTSPKSPRPADQPVAGDAQIALRTAIDAAVLLKNDDNVLPLETHPETKIALIGPGAGQTVAIGRPSERGLGFVKSRVSSVEAMREGLAGHNVDLTFAVENDMEGTPIPADLLTHKAQPGWSRIDGDGSHQVDMSLDFTTRNRTALPASTRHTWEGDIQIDNDGYYGFNLALMGARAVVEIDGKTVSGSSSLQKALHGDTVQANQDNILPTRDGLDNLRAGLQLSKGEHAIKVSVTGDTSDSPEEVRLSWVTPAQREANHLDAIQAAKNADTAIVFAWTRGAPVFGLPGEQNALIDEVASANPNTIVVLNTSQPIDMPWLNKVKGVVEMWWPGDQGGQATADVLLGKASPAGRLPFTWAKKLSDYPATDPAFPERSGKGVNGVTRFSEGLDIGYRWFDRQAIEPVFPFGYGLSYTRFSYNNLVIRSSTGGGLDVKFDVSNTGKVDSDEVPQVYLGAPASGTSRDDAQFAVRKLAGFSRIHLKTGETRHIDVRIPLRQLQYWSVAKSRWITVAMGRTVYVGTSSRDIRLSGQSPAED